MNIPTNQAVINASDNVYISAINGNRITYSKDFYIVLYKKLETGMNPLEAYEALGFSVKDLGEDRAYAATNRAKKLHKKIGYTIDPSNYDGRVPRDQMGELTRDEEYAYMKARTVYLEYLVELKKKLPTILEERLSYLKRAK